MLKGGKNSRRLENIILLSSVAAFLSASSLSAMERQDVKASPKGVAKKQDVPSNSNSSSSSSSSSGFPPRTISSTSSSSSTPDEDVTHQSSQTGWLYFKQGCARYYGVNVPNLPANPLSFLSTAPRSSSSSSSSSSSTSSTPAKLLSLEEMRQITTQKYGNNSSIYTRDKDGFISVNAFLRPPFSLQECEKEERLIQLLELEESHQDFLRHTLSVLKAQKLLMVKKKKGFRHSDPAYEQLRIYGDNDKTIEAQLDRMCQEISLMVSQPAYLDNMRKQIQAISQGNAEVAVSLFSQIWINGYVTSLTSTSVLEEGRGQKKSSDGKGVCPSTRPQYFSSHSPFDQWLVLTNINSFWKASHQLRILYDFLPEVTIQKDLRRCLSLPSLYFYLQGYMDNPAVPGSYIKIIGSTLSLRSTHWDPHTCLDMDRLAIENMDQSFLEKIYKLAEDSTSLKPKKKKKKKKTKKEGGAVPHESSTLKLAPLSSQNSIPPSIGSIPAGTLKDGMAPANSSKLTPSSSQSNPDASPGDVPPVVPVVVAPPKPLVTPAPVENKAPARQKYVPQKMGPSLLEMRIKQIIDSNQENHPFTLKCLKPRSSIVLADKEHVSIYKSLFNLHKNQPASLIKWGGFVHFFEVGLGGRITPSMGNGSAHILEIPLLSNEEQEVVSSRPLHKPHPGDILYDELIKRFRRYCQYWGLAPHQGNVKF